MARPKKGSLSPEQQAERKKHKQATKADQIAATALSKVPETKEKRDELFREAEALKKHQQELSGRISQHRKRMTDVYGLHPKTIQLRQQILDLPDGVYEAVCKQLKLVLEDAGRPFQLHLFEDYSHEIGKLPPGDDAPLFDATTGGERTAAERGDDPGRARRLKVVANEPKPSDGIPLNEAEEKFSETLRKANEKTEQEIKQRATKADGNYTILN